jgi:hypothetical protein
MGTVPDSRHTSMKSLSNLLAVTVLLAGCRHQAGTVTWIRTYGGPRSDVGHSVQQTADGGYIVGGTRHDTVGPDWSSVYLVRTDENGDTLWTKTIGGAYSTEGNCVRQTSDGGLIVAGTTISVPGGNPAIYLVKTDANGNEAWSRTLGNPDNAVGHSVLETSDGGFVVVGSTYPAGHGVDVYLVRTDADGDTIWTKALGGEGDDWAESVTLNEDGGFTIAGSTQSFGAGSYDVYLIRTAATGDTLWTRTFGGPDDDRGYAAQQTSDGGFIVTGGVTSSSVLRGIYLVRTDAGGDTVWTRTILEGENTSAGKSIQQTEDGGYVVAGYTGSIGAGWDDVLLTRIDASGSTLWIKTFGGPEADDGYSVQQTSDHGFIIAGATWSFDGGYSDVYLIKTDSLGNAGP